MTVRLRCDKQRSESRSLTSTAAIPAQAVVAEVQCVSVWCHALWRVNGTYLKHLISLPTMLRCVHKKSARCIKYELERQLPPCEWAPSLFESGTRLPIADSHGSNKIADEALYEGDEWKALAKYICYAHRAAKIGDL